MIILRARNRTRIGIGLSTRANMLRLPPPELIAIVSAWLMIGVAIAIGRRIALLAAPISPALSRRWPYV